VYIDKNYYHFSYNGFNRESYLKWGRMQMDSFLSIFLNGNHIFMWDPGVLYDNKTLQKN
jgi:hypothetical protein